jgi:hypothetical protein
MQISQKLMLFFVACHMEQHRLFIFIMPFLKCFMPIAEYVKESSYSLCCPLEDKMLFSTHFKQSLIASFLSGNY